MNLSSRRFCITSDLKDDCICFGLIIYISCSGQFVYKCGQIHSQLGQVAGHIGQILGQTYAHT